jgi:dephospho-CoA kinase
MLHVGLTGGIGAGKSTVAGRLVSHGAVLIDSDRLAREAVAPGTEGLRAVVAEFGTEVLAPDGTLDRPALAARVFGDDDARVRLNAVVHPLVGARSAELLAAAPADAVVVQDIPLLVEGGMAADFPLVVVVHADTEVRMRRLVGQRGMPESDAWSRIAAQATDGQHRAVADVWLENSGTRDGTLAAVDRLWAERLLPFEENLRTLRRAPRPRHAELVPPDETWPAQAERVAVRVAAAAGDQARRVDHIGSTAVPGLAAKDVLDLQVVVHDIGTAGQVADGLAAAGLVRGEGRWWDNALDGTRRDKAIALNADPGRAANCHIRPLDSPVWREALLLRDWLRAHPDGIQEYAEVKLALARQRLASIDAYAAAKTPFISGTLARAERWAVQTGWQATA